MSNPIIRIKRGSTTPGNLSSGELAIDLTNKNLFVGKADGSVLAIGGEGTFATKTYADSAVSTANTSLTAAIAAEESARIAADGVISANLAQELLDRASADTALDGKITVEKNRVDAILSAADADKDSFAEIVTLINSIDTENDTTFAGYVLSNDAALAAEVTRATGAEATLTSDLAAEVTRATAAEATLTSDLASEVTSRIADVDAEETRALAAESALDSRVTALETTIDGGTY